MKRFLSFILISFVFVSVYAQGITLQSVCEGLAKTPNTTGDFVQIKTINASGRKLKSSGAFIIAKEGIMWKTLKPFPSTLIVTNDSMIQIGGDGTKSVMSGADNQVFQNISQTLNSVFEGNSKSLEKNFTVEFKEASDGTWTAVLTPRDSTIGSVMKTLTLEGKASAGAVELNSLEMEETSSNKIRYEFANQKYPKELTADEKANFTTK